MMSVLGVVFRLVLAAAALTCVLTATAAPVDAGWRAYQRGDYDSAPPRPATVLRSSTWR